MTKKTTVLDPTKPTLVVARNVDDARKFINEQGIEKAVPLVDFRTVVQYEHRVTQVVLLPGHEIRSDWNELRRVLGVRDLLRNAVQPN